MKLAITAVLKVVESARVIKNKFKRKTIEVVEAEMLLRIQKKKKYS